MSGPSSSPGPTGTSDVVEPRGDGTDGDHRIAWTDGTAVFTCHSPHGSPCRRWCTTCLEACPGPGADDDGATHTWEDLDFCRVTSWLDGSGDPYDTWAGDSGPMPQRSGALVTEWTGDDYLWSHAED